MVSNVRVVFVSSLSLLALACGDAMSSHAQCSTDCPSESSVKAASVDAGAVIPCLAHFTRTGALNTPAGQWCQKGQYFTWTSTLPENAGRSVQIFWTCRGDRANPAIYMNHGWPTQSQDFSALMEDLSKDHYVCALDTPGYGLSDKPRNGYVYSIFDDARLVDYFIKNIVGLTKFALLTHDKGDSVGLEFISSYEASRKAGKDPGYEILRYVMTNGNVYLPLANISQLQSALLDPATGASTAQALTGQLLAESLRTFAYSPPLRSAEVDDLAREFDYQNGTAVLDQTVKYLNERAVYEDTWLDGLKNSTIPVTLVWGLKDTVAPVAVADYVWDNILSQRAGVPATYWHSPCANHYIQHDRTADLAAIVRNAVDGSPISSTSVGAAQCAPILKKSSQ